MNEDKDKITIDKNLISEAEAGKRLNLPASTLRRRRLAGTPILPYMQMGPRTYKYDPEDIQKLKQDKVYPINND